jgi:2-phospho-L-lactate/phosphoenolpyruvate guanylyltransferase
VTCWIVIPVKPPEQAKSRLELALSGQERGDLVELMLVHVVKAAQNTAGIDRVALLGPSRLGLPDDIPLLSDPGGGLNPALDSARAQIGDASGMIVLFADLPQLTSDDVVSLAAISPTSIAIAPDRHGTGTNALSLPLPAARDFTFAFGPDSFAKHLAEAARLGIEAQVIHSPGLARDVDMPEDLPDAAGLIAAPK